MSTSFKRLESGTKFSHKGERYRKFGGRYAIKLKASGVGETHNKIRFNRSTAVEAVS